MGSVKEEITRLETAKKDIETAIETCGVDVPNTELIDTYASYIRQIPSAVFSGLNVDPVGGSDMFVQSIKQTNGLIEATVGGLVSTSNSGLVPKADGSAGLIDKQSDDYVLTYKDGTIDWYKLPANAFKNDDNNTTYTLSGTLNGNDYDVALTPSSGSVTGAKVPAMGAASSSADGTAGLVPAPAKNKHNSFLRGDGTWVVPDNTTYSVMTGATASDAGKSGLVPQPAKGDQGKFLSGAGTWTALPSLSITDSESGNAVTDVEVSGHGITLKRGTTFSVNGHKHSSDDITALTSYVKATTTSAIASTDSLNDALGKLELKADTAYTLTAGAYDGDGTIENLAEILKVLEGISDTDTIQAIIGKYLPLTGGMMTGDITFDTNRMLRWHQSDSYSISCPTGGDGAYLLLKAHNGITMKKRLSIYTNAESLPNTAYNLYTDGFLYAASATFGTTTISGGSDLNLQAGSTDTSDTGDIVFKNYNGTELGRIWLNGSQFSLRYGDSDPAKTILHSGNSSVSKSGETLTVKINGTSCSLTNNTYNFSGVSFTSGDSITGEHNCNNITSNGHWYYTSNGPSNLGEQSTDGALYSQAYNSSWVAQIAQDYRNGNLFTRGKNNGTWTSWRAVAYQADTPWSGAPTSISDINTFVKANRSYIGSLCLTDGTWYNLISCRHRNGSSDGNAYGMYFYSTLTNKGNLMWNKEYNGTWQGARTILDSNNWSSYITIPTVTDYYWANVPISATSNTDTSPTFANATTTGLLTVSTGGSHYGIKVGDTYINSISGNLIFQNNSAIRFGGDSWDYNVWAGLKYVHSSKTIYLGLADGSAFIANNAQSGGTVTFPGVSTLSLTSGSRIHANGGNLYLGNSNNAGWLMLQDVCSQSGNTYWHIYNSGAAKFGQITSTVADGTAPFVTSSTTKVSNWNADMVDGFHIYERNLGVNGTNWTFASMYNTVTTTIYAPTTAGTSGYLLKSNGSGAPTWTNTIGSSTTSLDTSYITKMYADALYLKSYYPGSGDIYISGFTSAPDSTTRVRLYTARYAIIKDNSSSTACAIYAPGGFYESSDERLKTILNPVKVNLEKLSELRKVYYSWKEDSDNKTQLGAIAQDVQKLFPEIVSEDSETGYLSLAYDKLSVVALAAIDELYAMIKTLRKENEELKGRLSK